MNRILSLALVLWTCMFVGACSSVTTNHLIGEPIEDTRASELNGAWSGGDALFLVKSLGDGKVRVGSPKWSDSDQQFTVEQDAMFLRAVGDAIILHTVEQQEEGAASTTRYALSRLVLAETGELIFMPADVDRFASAVRNGELKGEIVGKGGGEPVDGFMSSDVTNVRLSASKAELDAYLTAERIALLFTLDGAGVLRRLDGVDVE